MRLFPFVPVFLATVVLLGGCRSTSSSLTDSADPDAPADTSAVYTQAIHVLVDGDDYGTIPKTVRIRRSFGTQVVSLWQAGEEIRIYEIEISKTGDGQQMLQGFWSTPSSDGAAFEVKTLPKGGKNTYRIPYTDYPLRIDDNEFGVILLVSN